MTPSVPAPNPFESEIAQERVNVQEFARILERGRRAVRRDAKLEDELARVRYSAFCQQWVAIAWCMLIGKESP